MLDKSSEIHVYCNQMGWKTRLENNVIVVYKKEYIFHYACCNITILKEKCEVIGYGYPVEVFTIVDFLQNKVFENKIPVTVKFYSNTGHLVNSSGLFSLGD